MGEFVIKIAAVDGNLDRHQSVGVPLVGTQNAPQPVGTLISINLIVLIVDGGVPMKGTPTA